MRGVLRMHHAAAVHVHRLPRHFSRSGTAQKDDHCRDIVRLLPASKRNHLMNLVRCPVFISPAFLRRLLVVPRSPDRFIQRRFDHSRTNGIDSHSGCREILRHALRKIDIRRFAGTVWRICLRSHLTGNARKENDRSLSTRSPLFRQCQGPNSISFRFKV